MDTTSYKEHSFLSSIGIGENNLGVFDGKDYFANGIEITSLNPNNNKITARIKQGTVEDYERCMKKMESVKDKWMATEMPFRGDIVRKVGEALRKKKVEIGRIVSLEMGKVLSEGLGEVQEFIDMCDYACGLSRILSGKVIQSERKDHVLLEHWNPLGIIGVISAFNFPCAVFGWNFCVSMICGNCLIWKGASSTSLVTIAMTKLIHEVFIENNVPEGVLTSIVGSGRTIGELFLHDKRVELLSFTGSTSIGQRVSESVHKRFGRTILELGGNNCMIVCEDADFENALKASLFSAVGTAGQRCTSLRRLVIHEKIYDEFVQKLVKAYGTVKIGSSLDESTLLGPLHNKAAIKEYTEGLEEIKKQGGKILYGGKVHETLKEGNFVYPTIVEIDHCKDIVKTELFVPILYVFKFKEVDEAIKMNNSVPQGLSSSIFTTNMKNVFKWTGPNGSDCGLVNVNVGTSGAEIGGAFGGEKETGGGRESGSDAWKQYMRRSTCTINYGNELPLSQGVKFDL